MRITVNGREMERPDGLTLGGLLQDLNIDARRVVIEINGEIINRDDWEARMADVLNEGDVLELVQLVGGG